MKKLLSILICVALGIGNAFVQAAESSITITANINPSGVATVKVGDNTSTTSASAKAESGTFMFVIPYDAELKVSLSNINSDYYFTGWTSTTMPGKGTGYDATNTSWTYKIKRNQALQEEHTVTANFSPYWNIAVGSMFAYEDQDANLSIVSADVVFSLHGATSITPTLADGTLQASNFAVTNPVDNSDGTKTVTISYIGSGLTLNDVVGKNVKLTLTGDNGKSKTVEVGIIETPTLTFIGTDKGKYSIASLVADWDGTDIAVPILNPNQLLNVPIILTEDYDDDYIFLGWSIHKDGDAQPTIDYSDDIKQTFTGSATIEPIFIPNTCGYIVMYDNGKSSWGTWEYNMQQSNDKIYYDLHEALVDAENLYQSTSKNQFVVFENLKTIFDRANITRRLVQPNSGKEGTVPYREGGYTIQKGVKLLIPGNSTYVYGAEFEITSSAPTGMYRKMIVAPNTKIYVDYGAEIIVYAKIYALGQTWAGIPFDHGQIELGMGSEIILGDPNNTEDKADADKAKLNALGYVTNTEEVVEGKYNEHGKVTAYRGAYVHEILQYTNWRGGSAASTIASDKKVFPIPQYYIQNIEAPAIFHTGAKEEVTAMANVSSTALNNSATYIGTGSDGFFALGNKMKIIKYYDRKNDKQKYIFEGESASTSTVDFNNISLTFQLIISININSSDFPLPISSNFDVEVDKATINFKYNIIALPGVKLLLKKDAVANILEGIHSDNKTYPATMYIYDKEQAYYLNGTTKVSYMGSIGTPILQPLFYTPYGSQTTTDTPYSTKNYKRTHENAETILDIRGILNVGKDYSSTSVLYTTAGSGQIISNGEGGKIKFYNIDNGQTTKVSEQYVSEAVGYVSFPVTNAVLTNADGSTVETASAAKGTLYTYTSGKWIPSQKWTVKDFEVTLPDQSVTQEIVYAIDQADTKLQGKTFTATISGTGFEIDGNSSLTFNTNEDLKVQVKYAAQNKHNLTGSVGVLTLKNTDYNITYTTELKAIENYTPKFTATTEPITIPLTYVGESNVVSVQGGDFQINTTQYNVTSLIEDMESDKYQNLTWDWESTNDAFTFAFGDGRNALSDAKITFAPTAAGDQSATITLTAKYTDATSTDILNTEEVKLVVNAKGANLATNTLKLTDDCKAALDNMCVNVPITLAFDGLTANKNSLEVTIENNGTPESPILTLDGDGTSQKPFVVTAKTIPTTMPTINVTQAKDLTSGVGEGNVTCEVNIGKCEPIVQWNWSDMYFGYSYDNPIKSNSTGDYTLTLKSIKKSNGTQVTASNVMIYDANAKTAEVKQNTGEYVATFEFSQEGTDLHAAYPTTEFTAHIYASPAQLSLCVDNERIFTAINYAGTENGVSYDATTKTIDIAAGASWTITFIGVPDILSFTPTVNTQLLIEQRPQNGSFSTVLYEEVIAGKDYSVELLPSTQFVKFTVVAATTLKELCVSELNRVRLKPDILYMPISDDPENAPTTSKITATYVNRSGYPLNMISSDGTIIVSPNKLEPTAAGEYKEVDLTISSKAISEFAASVSVEHKDGGHAQVNIETYRFPQKLPIQLEKGIDPAKRFHFVTTTYKNTEWDATQYAVKMQNITTADDNQPYVIFAFDGAPSFISFVPLVATDIANWKIKESEDGLAWGECSGATFENGVLKQILTYTTRYVRVTYVGNKPEVVQMTKVNILSDQSAIPNPEELELTDANKYVDDLTVGEDLNLTVVNLTNLSVAIDNEHFTLSYGSETPATTFELDVNDIADVFGEDVVGAIPFKVFWDASQATDFGNITFTTEVDGATKTLATVPLVGTKAGISEEDVIYTGVKTGYTLNGTFNGIYAIKDTEEKSTEHRKVDLSSTYDHSGKPLFDYLIIYGETTTTDGTTTITTPTTTTGSNAKTPVYVYVKDGEKYAFAMMEENANVANKMINAMQVTKEKGLRIYITGFCPYATTGYTKEDEGVWYFQGVNGAMLDIYLEDCYIYSRHKTLEGRAFSGRYDGQAFSEPFVRGSGGVLVFENQDNDPSGSFDVTIHTRRNNMFKSNYGCFFELMQGMRAYNVSSPIQVHLASDKHKANSKTTLTFDDKWPNDATNYDSFERTNGYLSLQKQVNNAPSIDLGNANTIVNFRGGQVELQNAAVVSPNYKTTFAISFRSGLMAGFPMAYGIGTDDVGGTVYFYDGTTTVIPMEVDIKYRDYYLMDTDANGNELSTTSCLRTPTNTFVYGGSHCMMRACEDVTSKGGAPTRYGNPLGLYKYPKTKPTSGRGGFGDMNTVGLVTPTDIPTGYNVESVTPNTNGTPDTNDDYLNFWFSTEDEPSVTPEVDKKINFWKACMTQISAEYMSYGGTVGGETMILPNEENKYLLYCQIDENISNVISAGTGFGEDRKYTYMAPVKDPTSGQLDEPYLSIPPSYVGEEYQNYIETVDKENNEIITGEDYTISEKVYYVVPTTADTWMTFTAPFNVEKLYVVEAYEEAKLAATPLKEVTDEEGNTTILNKRQSVLLEQAKHNADFAAFFGVAMALGREQTFEEIHKDYEGWAEYVDKKEKTRGKIELEHYNGNNFFTANYYLYRNAGEWTRLNGDKFDTKWEVVGEVAEGGILMHQGETYSMLFPYCTGCDVLKDAEGNIIVDANGLPQLSAVRDYWDYWSGKFLIFESTQATSNNPHTIKGSNYHEQLFAPATSGNGSAAVLTGNNTFALMTSNSAIDAKVYTYSAEMGRERFKNNTRQVGNTVRYQTVQPTVSFLIADIPAKAGAPARGVMRTGEIIYGKDNTATDVNPGGNIPTVGGGNDLFITSTVEGINIAVAEPQYVRVLSSTGAVLYSGMVQTAVDVALPTTGVYVITGENEVHKILH